MLTDKNVRPEPTLPTLPVAGGTLVDPTFGTTILRVTDAGDGKSNTVSYSYWPSLNCNSTRLFYMSDNTGMIADFDPINLRISNKRPLWAKPLPGGGQLGTEDAMWSGVDPDLIFSHWGMKVWAYNVKTLVFTLVADFTGKAGIAAYLQQMSKSPDDNAFGFNLQDANWTRIGCLAWRKSQNDLYTLTTAAIDEVQVDKAGKYLVITTGQQGATAIEVRIVDLDTKTITDLTDGKPDYAPGHHDCGRGVIIGEDNWNNALTIRRLDTPHTFKSIINFNPDWSQGSHISLLCDDEKWVLVSKYLSNTNTSSGLFKNEIFLLATDGSEQVQRICHHRSSYFATRDYWDSPRANISKDGKFAVFTSNWGSTTRRDVFVVAIPQVAAPVQPPITPPTPQTITLTLPKGGAEMSIKDTSGNVIGIIKINPPQ